MSAGLQAGLIALAGGYLLSDVPAAVETAWWPYFLFGYGFLAAVLPWLIGGFLEGEFGPVSTLIFGVVVALPFWLAAGWLAGTPYQALATGSWIMVALWGVHLLISVGAWIRSRLRAPPKN